MRGYTLFLLPTPQHAEKRVDAPGEVRDIALEFPVLALPKRAAQTASVTFMTRMP